MPKDTGKSRLALLPIPRKELECSRITLLAAIFIIGSALVPLSLMGAYGSSEGSVGTRAVPVGYRTLDDLVSSYPAFISGSYDVFRVTRSLELGASVPLYVSEGQTVLFDDGTYLNLSAPALFEGTEGSPVVLRPFSPTGSWGGLGLTEADPSERPVLKNVTVEKAVKGIRSAGSDLLLENGRIGNCSRVGLEVTTVTGPTAKVIVKGTTFINCTYYGVQLSDVRDVRLDTVTTLSCGTGIRMYRTTCSAEDLFVLDSGGIGISLVGSDLSGSGIRALSAATGGGSTTYQLLVHSSDVDLVGGVLGRSKVCTMAISGSKLGLREMEIGPAFTDGVQSNDSSVSMTDVTISSCRESALHSEGSLLMISGSVLDDNGKGSGNFRYSTLYLRGSTARTEAVTIKGSGDYHVEAYDSHILMGNSTLGPISRPTAMLDGGSVLELVDTRARTPILFRDPVSKAISIDTFAVRVKEFTTGDPIVSASVDLLGPDNGYIGSYSTDTDGTTPVMSAVIWTNTSTGNTSNIPLHLAITKTGFEVTMMGINDPFNILVEADLYPPNEPPSLTLLRPQNGSMAGPKLEVEGYLSDDLDVHKLQVRVGSGPWYNHEVPVQGASGFFHLNITLTGLSSGQQVVSFQAFDGVHTSTVQVRTVNWIGPSILDSDGDGLLDMDEDANGNGDLDEGETDPNDPDTDGDGLMDGSELDMTDGNATDPLDPDTDGDFLLDGAEDQNRNGRVDATETDPNDIDTDGDGVSDKDDHYPLDPKKSRPENDDGDDNMLVLILIIVIVVVLGLIGYLTYIKVSGSGTGQREVKVGPSRRAQVPARRVGVRPAPWKEDRGRPAEAPGKGRPAQVRRDATFRGRTKGGRGG